MALTPIPPQAANAINDMLDRCAVIEPGHNVLIVAVPDGLYGGLNVVDEQTLTWIQMGVQLRGANPTLMWVDTPSRPSVVWSETGIHMEGWRVPKILAAAVAGADVIIGNAVDLTYEEELREWSGQIGRAHV